MRSEIRTERYALLRKKLLSQTSDKILFVTVFTVIANLLFMLPEAFRSGAAFVAAVAISWIMTLFFYRKQQCKVNVTCPNLTYFKTLYPELRLEHNLFTSGGPITVARLLSYAKQLDNERKIKQQVLQKQELKQKQVACLKSITGNSEASAFE